MASTLRLLVSTVFCLVIQRLTAAGLGATAAECGDGTASKHLPYGTQRTARANVIARYLANRLTTGTPGAHQTAPASQAEVDRRTLT